MFPATGGCISVIASSAFYRSCILFSIFNCKISPRDCRAADLLRLQNAQESPLAERDAGTLTSTISCRWSPGTASHAAAFGSGTLSPAGPFTGRSCEQCARFRGICFSKQRREKVCCEKFCFPLFHLLLEETLPKWEEMGSVPRTSLTRGVCGGGGRDNTGCQEPERGRCQVTAAGTDSL